MTLPNTPPSTSCTTSGFTRRRRINADLAVGISIASFPTTAFGDSSELLAALNERRRIREYTAIKARMLSSIRQLCERIVASNESVSRFIPIPKEKIQREIDYVIARFKSVHIDVVKLFLNATHKTQRRTNTNEHETKASTAAVTTKTKRTKRVKLSLRDPSPTPIVAAVSEVRAVSPVSVSPPAGVSRRVLRARAHTTSRALSRQRSAASRSNSDRHNFSAETTAILKDWFIQHIVDPYPTDREKQHFVDITGITYDQVSNWMVNARMRHWKKYLDEHKKRKQSQAVEEAATVATDPPMTNPQPPPLYHNGNAFSSYQFVSPTTAISEMSHLSMPSMMLPRTDTLADARMEETATAYGLLGRASGSVGADAGVAWDGELSDE